MLLGLTQHFLVYTAKFHPHTARCRAFGRWSNYTTVQLGQVTHNLLDIQVHLHVKALQPNILLSGGIQPSSSSQSIKTRQNQAIKAKQKQTFKTKQHQPIKHQSKPIKHQATSINQKSISTNQNYIANSIKIINNKHQFVPHQSTSVNTKKQYPSLETRKFGPLFVCGFRNTVPRSCVGEA